MNCDFYRNWAVNSPLQKLLTSLANLKLSQSKSKTAGALQQKAFANKTSKTELQLSSSNQQRQRCILTTDGWLYSKQQEGTFTNNTTANILIQLVTLHRIIFIHRTLHFTFLICRHQHNQPPVFTATIAPQYLSDCVSTVSALSGRYRLSSTCSADFVLPRTRTRFGERRFSYCGPAAWNTLPSDLHDITDTGNVM